MQGYLFCWWWCINYTLVKLLLQPKGRDRVKGILGGTKGTHGVRKCQVNSGIGGTSWKHAPKAKSYLCLEEEKYFFPKR